MTTPLDLRVLLLVICASAAFTVLCPLIYRRDPLRRKWFLAALSATLLLAPWWSAAGLWRWPLGLEATFLDILDRPVPWLAQIVWWPAGALMMARTIVRVGRGRRGLLALPLLTDAGIQSECNPACNAGTWRPWRKAATTWLPNWWEAARNT